MEGYFRTHYNKIQTEAQKGIDNLIEILESPINPDELKENKLQNACESKKEALTAINYISNNSELSGKRKKEIISSLEKAFDTLIETVGYSYVINGVTIDENEGLTPDIQKNISRAKRIAFEISIDIAETIDILRENEEVKQKKIDNLQPGSIIEMFDE
jgi:hypothetical protein